MRVSAKVDYAVRAAAVLAAAAASGGGAVRGDVIGESQQIPVKFLETILAELRRAGIVASQRGAAGGYWLAVPAVSVSVADIIRAVEGPLADVRGAPPERLDYPGAAAGLRDVWVAARAGLRAVLEAVTLEDIVEGRLPEAAKKLLDDPDAWARR